MKKTIVVLSILIGFSAMSQVQAPVQAKLNIQLTREEAEVVLNGLQKLPYEQSAGLIQNIYQQAQHQLQPQPAPKDTTTKKKP